MRTLLANLVALVLFCGVGRCADLLWTPSPNAIPCHWETPRTDPLGEFTIVQVWDRDLSPWERQGSCLHTFDAGHYGEAAGHVDGGPLQPPAGTFSLTVVIDPVPGWNFDCAGWTDRPADGSVGHDGVIRCVPFCASCDPVAAPLSTAEKRALRKRHRVR